MKIAQNAHLGLLIAAAVTGAIAVSATAAQAAEIEQCYGVAKAGKNDCKTDAHSCAGQSKVDKDPASFVDLPAGMCEKINGGSTKPKK